MSNTNVVHFQIDEPAIKAAYREMVGKKVSLTILGETAGFCRINSVEESTGKVEIEVLEKTHHEKIKSLMKSLGGLVGATS